ADALYRGYHLLVLDLHPPTQRDPQGIHGAIWCEIADDPWCQPEDKPLTVAAYNAGPPRTAYIELVAVGDPLPEAWLFLEPDLSVPVPLEETYLAAYRGVPQRWKRVLEATEPVSANGPVPGSEAQPPG